MNLRGIANAATRAINPNIPAQILASIGYTTSPDGSRVPGYADPVDVQIQRQELSQKDLLHIDGLNISGVLASIYINGNWYSVNRADGKGGDIIRFNEQEWLVIAVPELWPDWTRVIACLQRST